VWARGGERRHGGKEGMGGPGPLSYEGNHSEKGIKGGMKRVGGGGSAPRLE